MKTGIRKPNIKKSISARTTGKVKRAVKKSVNPMYGKKGAGFVKDPVKSVKSSIYHKTTVGVSDIVKTSGGGSARPAARSTVSGSGSAPAARQRKKGGAASVLMIIFGVLFLIGGVASFSTAVSSGVVGLILGGLLLYFGIRKRRTPDQDPGSPDPNA